MKFRIQNPIQIEESQFHLTLNEDEIRHLRQIVIGYSYTDDFTTTTPETVRSFTNKLLQKLCDF